MKKNLLYQTIKSEWDTYQLKNKKKKLELNYMNLPSVLKRFILLQNNS